MLTIRYLSRETRLLLAGVLGVALLWAAMTLHAHWGAFIQWCLAMQITLHRYLVMYLLQLNDNQYSGGVWLLVGAFLYGVLHAIGPGHGNSSSPRTSVPTRRAWRQRGLSRSLAA